MTVTTVAAGNAAAPEPASVYVLARRDGRRFKLGWSLSPLARARQLPEFGRGELDLDASRAIWLPTRSRAEQVERSMHKLLAPYRVDLEQRHDRGHTGRLEWFAGHAQVTALRMLGQMPLQSSGRLTALVQPLVLPGPADGAGTDAAAQDTWWRIEDILARLAMLCRITVDDLNRRGCQPTVTVHGLKPQVDADITELRCAALNAESYQCWHEGRPAAFVQTLRWEGDDLVLSLMPLSVLERWEDGADLAWQVRGFLARLQQQSRRIPT